MDTPMDTFPNFEMPADDFNMSADDAWRATSSQPAAAVNQTTRQIEAEAENLLGAIAGDDDLANDGFNGQPAHAQPSEADIDLLTRYAETDFAATVNGVNYTQTISQWVNSGALADQAFIPLLRTVLGLNHVDTRIMLEDMRELCIQAQAAREAMNPGLCSSLMSLATLVYSAGTGSPAFRFLSTHARQGMLQAATYLFQQPSSSANVKNIASNAHQYAQKLITVTIPDAKRALFTKADRGSDCTEASVKLQWRLLQALSDAYPLNEMEKIALLEETEAMLASTASADTKAICLSLAMDISPHRHFSLSGSVYLSLLVEEKRFLNQQLNVAGTQTRAEGGDDFAHEDQSQEESQLQEGGQLQEADDAQPEGDPQAEADNQTDVNFQADDASPASHEEPSQDRQVKGIEALDFRFDGAAAAVSFFNESRRRVDFRQNEVEDLSEIVDNKQHWIGQLKTAMKSVPLNPNEVQENQLARFENALARIKDSELVAKILDGIAELIVHFIVELHTKGDHFHTALLPKTFRATENALTAKERMEACIEGLFKNKDVIVPLLSGSKEKIALFVAQPKASAASKKMTARSNATRKETYAANKADADKYRAMMASAAAAGATNAGPSNAALQDVGEDESDAAAAAEASEEEMSEAEAVRSRPQQKAKNGRVSSKGAVTKPGPKSKAVAAKKGEKTPAGGAAGKKYTTRNNRDATAEAAQEGVNGASNPRRSTRGKPAAGARGR